MYAFLFKTCSKDDGEASLAQRAIEAAKEESNNADSATMPITDHSYDPFPVTSDEWANRNPFAEDKTIRKLSPEQVEPDSTMKSHTPSPISSEASSKSPKSYTSNPSPQLSDQLSVDNCCSAIISPISKHSVSSIESGYDSCMSTPPSSIQMRNTNVTSPVFHQDGVPELIPAHKNGNVSYQQKPQINVVQSNVNEQQFHDALQLPKQYQTPSTGLPVNPTTDFLGGYVKQEPFTMRHCAENKCSYQSVQQSTINNASEEFSRNPNPILGVDTLMSSFDDSIPPIAPLKELKTEDLEILEIPTPPQNVQQVHQSTQWQQNMQYIPNGAQFNFPKNHVTARIGHGNFAFNPLQQQQQLRTAVQPQFLYHTN